VAYLVIRNVVTLPAGNDLLFHSHDGVAEMFNILFILFKQVQYKPEGGFFPDPGKCSELLYSFFQQF
jgi:hypothetical protein